MCRGSLANTSAYLDELRANSAVLLETVRSQMPSFGIAAASVREVAMNASSVQPRITPLGMVYDVLVTVTVITGSSTPLALPEAVIGTRRLLMSMNVRTQVAAAHAAGSGDTLCATPLPMQMRTQHTVLAHALDMLQLSQRGNGSGDISGVKGSSHRNGVGSNSAFCAALDAGRAVERSVHAALASALPVAEWLAALASCSGEGGCGGSDQQLSLSEAAAMYNVMQAGVLPQGAARRRLLTTPAAGCDAPTSSNVSNTSTAPGAVSSGGATSSSCVTSPPSTEQQFLTLILSAALDLVTSTQAINASVAAMEAALPSINDSFEAYGSAAQAGWTAMQLDITRASANVSARLTTLEDLLDQTLAAQTSLSNGLAATAGVLTGSLAALQQTLTNTVISSQLVLEGLGVVSDAVLDEYAACIFNKSIGTRHSFAVSLADDAALGARRRRGLLQRGTSGGDAIEPVLYEGYAMLPDPADFAYNLFDTWHTDPSRCVETGCENRVLAGLFMHVLRKPVASVQELVSDDAANSDICRGTLYPNLVTACRDDAVSRTVAFSDNGGVGSDPIFNQLSTLHIKGAAASDYYNTSASSYEVNPVTGMPFGFFHHPLQGYQDGYPVLFDTHVSEKRMLQLLSYVQDGGLLSSQLTDSMTMQMVTYNPEAVVFGYFAATFKWVESGVITMTHRLMALPAVEYSQVVSTFKAETLLPDVFLMLLVITYAVVVGVDVTESLAAQKKLQKITALAGPAQGNNPLYFDDYAEGSSEAVYGPLRMHSDATLSMRWQPLGSGSQLRISRGGNASPCGDNTSPFASASTSATLQPPMHTSDPLAATASDLSRHPALLPDVPVLPEVRSLAFEDEALSVGARTKAGPQPVAEAFQQQFSDTLSESAVHVARARRGSTIGICSVPAMAGRTRSMPRVVALPGLQGALTHRSSVAEADRALEMEIDEVKTELAGLRNAHGHSGDGSRGDAATKPLLQRARKYEARMTPFWMVYEVAVVALMIACVVLWYVYSAQLTNADAFYTRFGVYDADAHAAARYLLPARNVSEAAIAHFQRETSRAAPSAGSADRWRLPANMSGLEACSSMLSRVDGMYNTYVTYYFLQGFVLIMLVVRLIMYLSFQRRLSVIGGTLAAFVPELFHYAIVVTVLFCMLAIFLNTAFGYRVYAASTFGESVYTLFQLLVFGDDLTLYNELADPVVDSPLERSLASAFRGICSVIIVLVLRLFLITFIVILYTGLNQYAKHMPSVAQDLRRLLTWHGQKLRYRAPTNRYIDKVVDKVLEEGKPDDNLLCQIRRAAVKAAARSALLGAGPGSGGGGFGGDSASKASELPPGGTTFPLPGSTLFPPSSSMPLPPPGSVRFPPPGSMPFPRASRTGSMYMQQTAAVPSAAMSGVARAERLSMVLLAALHPQPPVGRSAGSAALSLSRAMSRAPSGASLGGILLLPGSRRLSSASSLCGADSLRAASCSDLQLSRAIPPDRSQALPRTACKGGAPVSALTTRSAGTVRFLPGINRGDGNVSLGLVAGRPTSRPASSNPRQRSMRRGRVSFSVDAGVADEHTSVDSHTDSPLLRQPAAVCGTVDGEGSEAAGLVPAGTSLKAPPLSPRPCRDGASGSGGQLGGPQEGNPLRPRVKSAAGEINVRRRSVSAIGDTRQAGRLRRASTLGGGARQESDASGATFARPVGVLPTPHRPSSAALGRAPSSRAGSLGQASLSWLWEGLQATLAATAVPQSGRRVAPEPQAQTASSAAAFADSALRESHEADEEQLTPEEAAAVTLIRDNLVLRFGGSAATVLRQDDGTRAHAAGGEEGVRSHKACLGGGKDGGGDKALSSALRRRLTVVKPGKASPPAGGVDGIDAAATDDDSALPKGAIAASLSCEESEDARLRHVLYRSAVVSLAQSTAQLAVLRAATAALEDMASAIAAAAPAYVTTFSTAVVSRAAEASAPPAAKSDTVGSTEPPAMPETDPAAAMDGDALIADVASTSPASMPSAALCAVLKAAPEHVRRALLMGKLLELEVSATRSQPAPTEFSARSAGSSAALAAASAVSLGASPAAAGTSAVTAGQAAAPMLSLAEVQQLLMADDSDGSVSADSGEDNRLSGTLGFIASVPAQRSASLTLNPKP
mmetsp:Transcript_8258/g.24923  ORF Transcript_8258/g.24923 Transcript_8258/m.24923 type:complete len:2121 (-) Transcript_8258:1576-7938(-)